MVVVVIVADAILLPAPPISVMSTEASCEQSMTGATTCSVVAVVVEPVLVGGPRGRAGGGTGTAIATATGETDSRHADGERREE
jgi:hypothetical protein